MLSSLGTAILAVSIVFPVLAMIAVALRLWARSIKSVGLKADDWLAVTAMILCIGQTISYLYGIGTGAIGTPVEDMTTDQFISFQKIIFGSPFLMMAALAVVKLSVLSFYKRVFAIETRFCIIANVLMVIIVLWDIASLLCQLFEQWPISDNWTTDMTGAHTNFILNYSEFLMAFAAIDLVLDVIILCLPLGIVSRLKLNLKRKLAVTGIFLLGALCVVAEAVRIWQQKVFLYSSGESFSVLYGPILTQILIWGLIEPCLSVVAACLPLLGPVFIDGRSPSTLLRSLRYKLSLRSVRSRNSSLAKSSKSSEKSGSTSGESGRLGSLEGQGNVINAGLPIAKMESKEVREQWHQIHQVPPTAVMPRDDEIWTGPHDSPV